MADPVEAAEESNLRPRRLAEFVGQAQLKEHLSIVLEAARRRGQAVDHLLFAGPPGLGKTTMAGIVAAEMGAGLRITSGPALVRAGDLAAILTDLSEGDVLFIDEIHRLGRAVEEIMYPAMEDFALDIVLGKGPAARSIRLDLPRFTLVGATTRTGLITGPLRDRFGFVARLDYYEPPELEAIIRRSARILGVSLDDAGATEIAGRSRGTPRIANRLLKRVRDYAEVRADGHVTHELAREGLAVFGVDGLGLGQGRPGHPRRLVRPLRGRPGRAVDAGGQRGRGDRHRRGRLRTVPHAAWPSDAHPSGPGGHGGGVAASRPRASGHGDTGAAVRLSKVPSVAWAPEGSPNWVGPGVSGGLGRLGSEPGHQLDPAGGSHHDGARRDAEFSRRRRQ